MHGLSRQADPIRSRITFISIRFFSCGRFRDSYYYTDLLHLCKSTRCIQQIHSLVISSGYERNPFVATGLIDKYCQSNGSNVGNARKVFDNLSDKDPFCCNTVIKSYVNLGLCEEAVDVYDRMRVHGVLANKYTYPFVIKACGALRHGKKGQVIHGHALKSGFGEDLFVGNALVAFYAKCQEVEMSRKVFDEIPDRDIVSWNSMISGYSVNDQADEAVMLFQNMLRDPTACAPDYASLVSVLPACSLAGAIQIGIWIHSYLIKTGIEIDAALGSGLISTYGNCGHVNVARDVFERIHDKNIVTWNAMMMCYGMHGYAEEALTMLSRLLESGLQPDDVMFLSLLSICSHAGMVAKAQEIFARMEDYGVRRSEKHYACMVDILGRAGFLDDAVALIKTMPMQAGKNVYGALLGACRIHKNMQLAEEAAEKLFVLDPNNAGRYIIMARMYEDVDRWEDAGRLRKFLQERKIRKPVGYSSVEVDCVHHKFSTVDDSHPFSDKIFDTLERLDMMMEDELLVV